MATQKHIEWLLEGVNAWNERREQENFQPDFEGADHYCPVISRIISTGYKPAPVRFGDEVS